MDTTFDHLLKEIKDKRDLTAYSILAGNLDSYEYKRLCGVIQGLDFANGLIKDLAKKLEEV